MRYQDRLSETTLKTMEILFRTARAVPEDKLTWKPLDRGRSVLDQLQECAQAPRFYLAILNSKALLNFDEKARRQARAERAGWDTLEACERRCQEATRQLCEAICDLTDEDLAMTFTVPGPEGQPRQVTLADFAEAHRNNMTYHIGQINYIQTLYGDFESH